MLAVGFPLAARADWKEPVDIEVPVIVYEDFDLGSHQETSDLDLANVVQVSARYVTTVQEAPAIVTVITDEQLKQQNAQSLPDALDRVPGWMRYGYNHSQFPYLLARGTAQAMLLLRDGISMFEPSLNATTVARGLPIETVKRIEVVTGPGGVLWGANSFLGVVNVVSKDANDVDGVEASAGYSAGPADNNGMRGYVMAGVPDYKDTGVDLFLHTSFESFESPHFQMPGFLYHSPQPQPNSPLIYGPLNTANPARSMLFNFMASVTRGPLEARVVWPFGVQNRSLTFAGAVIDEDLPQDDLPECQGVPPGGAIDDPPCIDRGKLSRKNEFHFFDRFVSLKWGDRFGAEKTIGANARAYLVQFVRRWDPIQILPAVDSILPGGLGFSVDSTTYRAGASFDSDIDFGERLRLVYGLEAFREWLPDRTTLSRQGAGAQAVFAGPYNLDLLPIACPHQAEWDPSTGDVVNAEKIAGCPVTFAFQTDRTVLGSYASGESRFSDKVRIQAGLRAQVAPDAISKRPYDTQLLGSGAFLYNLAKDWHLKLNFTQGFRPPVFQNTDANGEAVQIPGVPGLQPETSRAYQVEINARLKGLRSVREIDFRADYSYTVLENLILFPNGVYENLGTRGLHSGEFLGVIHLTGRHYLQLGYTLLRGSSEDIGQLRSLPTQWFNLLLVSKLNESVELTNSLRVVSSFEDPNRIVEYRDLDAGPDGTVQLGSPSEYVVVDPTDLVLDRIPPSAMLQFGARYTPSIHWDVQLVAVNALNALYYQPDSASSFSPRLDILPNPYERFRANLTATYRY